MKRDPHVLWLSVSPYLKCFDQRLLSQLAKTAPIRQWEYCQTVDEPCCIDAIVKALHEYLESRITLEKTSGSNGLKVHLIGHGVSGVIGLLYARRYPQQVASLTLLSVAAQPAVNWQAHYYALRHLLPCSREMVLAQMARLLFGQQPVRLTKALSQLLAKDLDSNLTLHSLARNTKIPSGSPNIPLLVCNGEFDVITNAQDEKFWHDWTGTSASKRLRQRDIPSCRQWTCPTGNHFFHFQHAATVASVITDHWHNVIEHSHSSANSSIERYQNRPWLTQLARQ
ncbi:MAG: alpha/beta hydrolase [Phormidesmis sp.]